MITIEKILEYKNNNIQKRYIKDYPNNELSAESAWEEILKFLWLTQKHSEDLQKDPNNSDLQFQCAIHVEMKEIDDMWHTFILFTQDYSNFCNDHFGRYIHHQPTVDEEPIANHQNFQDDLSKFISYAYDQLGEQTVLTWFRQYF